MKRIPWNPLIQVTMIYYRAVQLFPPTAKDRFSVGSIGLESYHCIIFKGKSQFPLCLTNSELTNYRSIGSNINVSETCTY
jgi:hypothetical protein